MAVAHTGGVNAGAGVPPDCHPLRVDPGCPQAGGAVAARGAAEAAGCHYLRHRTGASGGAMDERSALGQRARTALPVGGPLDGERGLTPNLSLFPNSVWERGENPNPPGEVSVDIFVWITHSLQR